MKLKKQSGQFNTYSAELTYGEILVLRNALAKSPGMGPEADEMLEGFNWYLEKMPEPGEEGDKKDGTSENPNMAKDKANDALNPMLLEPAPGEEGSSDEAGPEGTDELKGQEGTEGPVGPEGQEGEETLKDRFKNVPGVNKRDKDMELPEPPSEE